MDLMDTLSTNLTAKTVVELTLSPHFQRNYTALNKALAVGSLTNRQLADLACQTIDKPHQRDFYVLGSDVTSNPRPYAKTLPDRSCVYQPNMIIGNKPIVIGHQYSFVALLPEEDGQKGWSWVVPLSMQRVTSQENKELVGAKQLDELLSNQELPFGTSFCVEVADSAYSKPAYLNANRHHKDLVTITRARGTCTFYRQPVPKNRTGKQGRPAWYGSEFDLKASKTWGAPDQVAETTFTSHKQVVYHVEIQAWHDLLMSGKRNIPMHQHPFTLVRICLYDPNGKLAFQRPLWLIVIGERRMELSLLDIYKAYMQRYDLEHFFRFGKQKLLLDKFQTPDDKHEEHWWRLVALAYLQLWAAKELANCLPRPWERFLPSVANKQTTPAMVLRDMSRIIRQIGVSAPAPKRRGKSSGRRKGVKLTPRPRLPVMKKLRI